MGIYINGSWVLDYNGNGVWDGPDVDKVVAFGDSTYIPIVGDWNVDGRTKIGVYNSVTGTFLLDYNGNYVWDGPSVDKNITWTSVLNSGEIAVLGDWNGDGRTKIGIYSAGNWILDYNGNYGWDGTGVDKVLSWTTDPNESPVVGDWNGDGKTKIGVYHTGTWIVDYNGNYAWDGTSVDKLAFFGGADYDPMVGDWNISGKTKMAAYYKPGGTWAIDVNGNWNWDPPADVLTNFSAAPYQPVVGAWIRTKATLTVPLPNAILTGSPVVFNWNGGVGVAQHKLEVGRSLDAADVFSETFSPPLVTSQLVNLPMDGSIYYVRIGSLLIDETTWQWDRRQFTAVTAQRAILTTVDPPTSPTSSYPRLNSDTVTISWSAGVAVAQYSLNYYLGNGSYPATRTMTNGNTNFTISGLPQLGFNTIRVRLGSFIGESWFDNEYTYQVWDGIHRSVMKLPAADVSLDLSVSPTTFKWTPTDGATSYVLRMSANGVGGADLFNQPINPAPPGQDITTTVPINFPAGHPTLFVTLVPQAATYANLDYTYTPINASTKAVLLTPAPPVLTGATTFSWSVGAGATAYRLQIGKTPGNWFYDTNLGLSTTSPLISSIPTDGSTVIVRLSSMINNAWQYNDYTYQVPSGGPKAIIYSPIPITTLGGTSVTFWWGGAGSQTATYRLQIGNAAGNETYFNGTTTNTHQTVTGLPSDGRTVYVRLTTQYPDGSTPQFIDYTYSSFNAATNQSGIILGSSYQRTSPNKYLVTVTAAVPGANAQNISRVELFLENAQGSSVQGFACHALLYPQSSTLYLADDLGDLGPSPADRYINGMSMTPGNLKPAPFIDWPNNSQCTLSEQGSRIDYLGQDTISATFSVTLKPHIKGDFAVKALAELCPSNGGACSQSPLESLDPLPLLDPADRLADVLPMGYQAKGGAIRIDTGAGDRENFAFRFSHPHGVQQLKFAYMNISTSGVPNAGDASSCQITVSPLTGMVQLAGSQSALGADIKIPAAFLENSQCIVRMRDSKIQFLSPTEVLIRLNVQFKSPWDGSTLYFHRATDGGQGLSGWSNPDGFSFLARLQKPPEIGANVITVTSVAGLNACVSSGTEARRVCLVQAPGLTLGLNLNQYGNYVYETIEIRRSNVTIRGNSKYTTTIGRATQYPAYPDPLISVAMTQFVNGHPEQIGPFTGIVISDLTIDGGRSFAEISEPAVSTDVVLVNVGTPYSATAPTPSPGEGVRIENCRFINAPNGAIVASPPIDFDITPNPNNTIPADKLWIWNNHPTRGVLIQNNEFLRSFRAPIATSLNGTWWPSQTGIPSYLLKQNDPNYPRLYQNVRANDVNIIVQGKCDGNQATGPVVTPNFQFTSLDGLTSKTRHVYDGLPYYTPDNFIIQNNFFEENDTGAFGLDSVTNFTIRNNVLLNNYNNGWDCGGGVIAVSHCAYKTTIDNNFLWNRDVYTYPQMCLNRPSGGPQTNISDKYALASGLELWGRDFTINGNWIEYFPTEGIGLMAVDKAYVTNNRIRNTSRGTQDVRDITNNTTTYEDDRPGIQIANCGMYSPQAYRPVNNINIGKDVNGNISYNEIGNVASSYLQCTNGNSLGCFQSIYQSYGVRVREALCGGSQESITSPGSAYPLVDTVTDLNILYDSNTPLNRNRQGFACASEKVSTPGSVPASLTPCKPDISIGTVVNGQTCGTGGCP